MGTMGAMQRKSWFGLTALSSLWLAWNAQWLTIVPTLIPQAVKALVGGRHAELWSGLTVGAGALVALLITPAAGALSDRSRNPRGRRRRFLIFGVLFSCVGLVALGWAVSANLAALAAVFVVLQFWWNSGAGPFAGLIPDTVVPAQRPEASGWLNALGVVGAVVGAAAMFNFQPAHPWPAVTVWVVLSLVCLAVTLLWVREPAPGAPPPWRGLAIFARSFLLPLADNRNFYWVLVTRLLNNMGAWSVFTFLVFYLQFVVGVPPTKATQLMSVLLGVGAVLAIAASLAAAAMIRRVGAVRAVQGASWVMALSAVGYACVAFAAQLWLVVPLVVVFGLGNGVLGGGGLGLGARRPARRPGRGQGYGYLAYLPGAAADRRTGHHRGADHHCQEHGVGAFRLRSGLRRGRGMVHRRLGLRQQNLAGA
jgi:MFS family permease